MKTPLLSEDTQPKIPNTARSVRLLLAILALALMLAGGRAAGDAKIDLPTITNHLVSSVQGLKSLEYRVQMFEQDAAKPSAQLVWKESAGGYSFTFEQFNISGVGNFWISASSNRQGSMVALERGRILQIDKAWKDIPSEVRNFPLVTAPLEFLYNTGPNTWIRPSLELLKNARIEAKMTANTTSVERRKSGRPAVLIKMEGGVDRFLGIPVAYEVALDEKAAFAPFFWRTMNQQREVISELEVTRTQQADGVTLPAEIIVKYFALQASDVRKTPTNWQRFVFDQLHLNRLGDLAPSLDPASAELIVDVSTGIIIPVAR